MSLLQVVYNKHLKKLLCLSFIMASCPFLAAHNHWHHEHVYVSDPWYHRDHVYVYRDHAYPVYYYGYPYYYYHPSYYWAEPAPASPSLNINLQLGS